MFYIYKIALFFNKSIEKTFNTKYTNQLSFDQKEMKILRFKPGFF